MFTSPHFLYFVPIQNRVIEWLDEYHPGSFRQAQVSFSTRIPTAFPLGDSMSMSTTVSLYSAAPLIKHLVKDVVHGTGNNVPDASAGLPSVKEEDENDVNAEEVSLFIILLLISQLIS